MTRLAAVGRRAGPHGGGAPQALQLARRSGVRSAATGVRRRAPRNETGKITREALRHLIETRDKSKAEHIPTGIPADDCGRPSCVRRTFPGLPRRSEAWCCSTKRCSSSAATGLACRHIGWAKFLRPVRPARR